MPASKMGPRLIDGFLICDAEDGGPSDGDVAGAGDPAHEWLTAQLAGREVGGDQGATRRKRERGTGGVTPEMGVGVVGVMGSGTVCEEGGGRGPWMGGALGSTVTECDVVNGGGEAPDGAIKVISSTGVEGESDALGSAVSGSM